MKIFLYPITMLRDLWNYRGLIKKFVKREIVDRYKGAYLGLFWSILHPVLILMIYTFVFSVVFKARWDTGSGSKSEFALILFCGLIAYNIFAESVNKASGLIINNANYVKKALFPLEIFPIVIVGSSLIHGLISIFVLIIGIALLLGVLNWTLIFLPIVLLPILLISLGLVWFLSALGVFLRDIGYIVNVAVRALLFLSPIFYPISAFPKGYSNYFYLNPLSYVIEDVRRVLIWGQLPDWNWLMYGTLVGILITLLGYIFFQKAQRGFVNVLNIRGFNP